MKVLKQILNSNGLKQSPWSTPRPTDINGVRNPDVMIVVPLRPFSTPVFRRRWRNNFAAKSVARENLNFHSFSATKMSIWTP